MSWSFKIARFFGIDVKIHITFILLLIWFLFHYGAESVYLTLIVFTCIVMHEYGHALTARKFGIPTRCITLWPFGGVASLEGMTRSPKEEILTALAGPAVNLFLIVLTYLFFNSYPYWVDYFSNAVFYRISYCADFFFFINISLMLFNLIPSFPMDGGRVLRGILNYKYDLFRATEIAVKVGKFFAVVMFILGAAYDQMLMIIAVFIWFSGSRELEQMIQAKRIERLENGTATLEDMVNLSGGHIFDLLFGNMFGRKREEVKDNVIDFTNAKKEIYEAKYRPVSEESETE